MDADTCLHDGIEDASDCPRAPHIGRPILRPMADHGILILCPLGHVYHRVRPTEWAGSQWEALASDPTWTVTCDGTMPRV